MKGVSKNLRSRGVIIVILILAEELGISAVVRNFWTQRLASQQEVLLGNWDAADCIESSSLGV